MTDRLPKTTLVIFGISGDLSQRYLLPALAEICRGSEIRASLKILGISRRQISADKVLKGGTEGLKGRLELLKMDYDSAQDYQLLKDRLNGQGAEQVVIYFAVPPSAVPPIVVRLGRAGLNTSKFRLLLEKPFGTDLKSAKELIEDTARHFQEEQVYRIDHYLAKEMAQNIAVFLGSNTLFRDVWNNRFIEKIEIAAEESIGVEGRGHFYEQTGALRDIVQSHLLQLAALTLMEPCPDIFDFSMMRQRRQAALKHLKVKPGSVVKAQYQGYRQEVGNPGSNIETFVSLQLESADPKWRGVPISLLSGKRLRQKRTEIRVFFKAAGAAQANRLRLRVQPREGIELELWVKKPGYEQELQMLPLDFSYKRHFDRLPDAYEQVIVDALRGRSSLFAASGEVLASWEILQPLLGSWNRRRLKAYAPGSSAQAILKNT